mgnify:CR=1 FL=1
MEKDIILKSLKRRLTRLQLQRDKLIAEHKNKEQNFTYWGGYSLGYTKGKIAEIEDIIDILEEE